MNFTKLLILLLVFALFTSTEAGKRRKKSRHGGRRIRRAKKEVKPTDKDDATTTLAPTAGDATTAAAAVETTAAVATTAAAATAAPPAATTAPAATTTEATTVTIETAASPTGARSGTPSPSTTPQATEKPNESEESHRKPAASVADTSLDESLDRRGPDEEAGGHTASAVPHHIRTTLGVQRMAPVRYVLPVMGHPLPVFGRVSPPACLGRCPWQHGTVRRLPLFVNSRPPLPGRPLRYQTPMAFVPRAAATAVRYRTVYGR